MRKSPPEPATAVPPKVKPHSGALTLIDVAKVAGVSPITVSRALSRPDMVRSKTLDKVNAAVRQTGYVKNMLAGGLASNRSKLVALVLPQIADTIFAGTVQAVTDTLVGAGYQLLLGLSGYEEWREEIIVETILSRRPDGIILTGAIHTEQTRKRLLSAGIPVVETWDMTPSPIDMLVGFSHEEVGVAVATTLLQKGYKRFAILSADDPRATRRNQGLQATLAKHGITVLGSEILPAPASMQQGREGAGRLLDAGNKIDVIVCNSDALAHGALTEAIHRGLRVPEQIAVMGFGDLNFASQTLPALSTVRVDGALIGTLAAQSLLARLGQRGARHAPLVTDTRFELVQRGST